jgi:hypothetical protein
LRNRGKRNGLFLLLKANLDESEFFTKSLYLWRKNYNESWIMGGGDVFSGYRCYGIMLPVPESVRKNIRNEVQK